MTSLAMDWVSTDAEVTLRLTVPRSSLLKRLRRIEDHPSLEHLPKEKRRLAFALAELRALAGDDESMLKISGQEITLSHDLVSRLDSETAASLGLPPLVDLTFETEMDGTLGSPNFRLKYQWTRGGRRVVTKRTGAILQTDRGARRIPHPILEGIHIAAGFDPGTPLSDHWSALARFRRGLDPEAAHEDLSGEPAQASKIRMSEFLSDLKIISADAMSISPYEGPSGLKFDPVPFLREGLCQLETADGIEEKHSELDSTSLGIFQREVRRKGAAPAYRLADNTFLAVDRSAAPVLEVIAQKQRAPTLEREAFARNPRPAISDAMEQALRTGGALDGLSDSEAEAAVEAAAEPAFIETAEFSRRVVGVGQWQAPELPIPEPQPTTWMPEAFEDKVRARIDVLPAQDLRELKEAAERALAEGGEAAEWRGEQIPVNDAVVRDLRARVAKAAGTESPDAAGVTHPTAVAGPIVLETTENFEEVSWRPERAPRPTRCPATVPDLVSTSLMTHQEAGLDWTISAWKAGFPGVLNADEQGLGKTLQTIAFLAWLKGHMRDHDSELGGPILVVAPTSLLENWEAEVALHTRDGGLGELIRLYGSALSSRKRKGASGKDTADGLARLDFDALEEKILQGRGHEHWLLITYTTLTNYQHSLGRLKFSAAVFDEIQAVKNPASLRAGALRSINADFRIGLTGTPVENRSTDIWAVMDQLVPGALGSLREFASMYGVPEPETMRELHERVFSAGQSRPALGLRRLKNSVARDLPPKQRLLHPRVMPNAQASRYDEAREKLTKGSRGGMLKMLHHIRSVSVHTNLDDAPITDDATFVRGSARLSATIEILRSIQARQERALVFVEHRKMQYRFAELARQLFGLPEVPIINGETPVHKRLGIVRKFQRHLDNDGGFDLLVLGPRAAGTGLTLTAATHVIHLSRWWNPAVEEQCNDRIHRIGQKQPVTIHVPLAVHPRYRTQSFDCLLENLMRRKRGLATSVLWPAGDTPEDATALEEALVHSSTEPPSIQGLDDASLLTSLASYKGFEPLQKLAVGVYKLSPKAPDEHDILIATEDAGDVSRAFDLAQSVDHSGKRFGAAIFLSSECRNCSAVDPSNSQLVPITILEGPLLELWPKYAIVD